jgi:hypothetical protein
MAIDIELTMEGPHPARSKVLGVPYRLMHIEPAFDEVMNVLEMREVEIFDAWAGKYVDTGTLRDSLTLPYADGAIREAHDYGVEFGTSIPYAVYQRENGRSAIMRIDEADREAIAAIVLRYIAYGYDVTPDSLVSWTMGRTAFVQGSSRNRPYFRRRAGVRRKLSAR